MLVTAAGTIQPARVFVIGAGVAGLQAIGTAKRLGAVVQAYDVRAAAAEEIRSMGAKSIDLELETLEGAGGYAREMSPEFIRAEMELFAAQAREVDIIITTALIPGKRAPILVTTEMVEAMPPGAVVVDLAAERGGNCELTRPDETVVHRGVTVVGPSNPAALVPAHASQMYSKNIITFLMHLLGKEGAKQASLPINAEDEITRETLLTRDGSVVHPRVQ